MKHICFNYTFHSRSLPGAAPNFWDGEANPNCISDCGHNRRLAKTIWQAAGSLRVAFSLWFPFGQVTPASMMLLLLASIQLPMHLLPAQPGRSPMYSIIIISHDRPRPHHFGSDRLPGLAIEIDLPKMLLPARGSVKIAGLRPKQFPQHLHNSLLLQDRCGKNKKNRNENLFSFQRSEM